MCVCSETCSQGHARGSDVLFLSLPRTHLYYSLQHSHPLEQLGQALMTHKSLTGLIRQVSQVIGLLGQEPQLTCSVCITSDTKNKYFMITCGQSLPCSHKYIHWIHQCLYVHTYIQQYTHETLKSNNTYVVYVCLQPCTSYTYVHRQS